MSTLKSTSYEYGQDYQIKQAEKFRNRKKNHWKARIELGHKLVEEYALPRLGENKKEITVVDIGCSIGTFAIEFALSGYQSFGIDFDLVALEIAQQLAAEENVSPQFICGDISDWKDEFPKIDVAICFDIFEHLHDDELGALLGAIKNKMSHQGCLIFHTFPAQYDYIFFSKFRYPLIPIARYLRPGQFNFVLQIYALLMDIWLLITKRKTHKEMIEKNPHCNPLTIKRLSATLDRAGFDTLLIDAANLYSFKDSIQKHFSRQPISYRNIFGVGVRKVTR